MQSDGKWDYVVNLTLQSPNTIPPTIDSYFAPVLTRLTDELPLVEDFLIRIIYLGMYASMFAYWD